MALNRREMMMTTLVGLAFRAVPARASDERATISDADRQTLLKYLEQTRAMMIGEVAGLSDTQWRFKPSLEVWSAAETVEHVAVVEETVLPQIKSMTAQAPTPVEQRAQLKDQAVILVTTNRETRRLQAPEMYKPSNRWPTKQAQVAAFEEIRGRTIEHARTTRADLRAYFRDTPIMGPIDGYQWLLFLGGHCERHVKQLRELRANPIFPAA